ncbi:Protein bfr2 [Penicillium argentinense]|uniref:Protein BFR2 n=1 Tax=Penicillium argentinense TaxID=1131581 RepID=A0A9W9G671_9EURO|nr:Protein bfr2 [Penicillium argentinense]KAJ5112737.1 Protein bfr2 [Penicillium argentinense]
MAPAASRPGRSLADQLADLEDPTPKDFDPEDIERDDASSDEEGGKPSESNAGREHYQAVGKGKLRKQDPVSLGKQYAGSRVSRDDLDADSDDDPFATRSDNEDDDEEVSDDLEEDEDENAGLSDAEESESELEGSVSGEDDELSEGEEDSEDESNSDDDDDDDETPAPRSKKIQKEEKSARSSKGASSDDREELRRLMATDQKTIAATISEAAKADAAKGKAVKQQRATFDALLNTRIKLQKGLGAINEISGLAHNEENAVEQSSDEDAEAIKSAESAALALWSTLEELRTALAEAQSKDQTKKRKRSPVTSSTSSASLWDRMTDLESESLSHRRSVLDKWSSKVRGNSSSAANSRGKLLGSASGQQSITAVLDAHVATEIGDRATKRARQDSSDGVAAAGPIYDDTIFYQSLLRELVEQRMSSSEAMSGGGLDSLHQLPSRLPIHPVTGMRNDKVKRDVDTRASKGRKMKFNVHEKLQNFMAPEDRGSWTVRARDEFFASLLGRTASGLLGEGDGSASENESDDDREEGGLRLFRN